MAIRPKKNPITKIVGTGIKAITKSAKAAPKPKPKMSKEKKKAVTWAAGAAGTSAWLGAQAVDSIKKKNSTKKKTK